FFTQPHCGQQDERLVEQHPRQSGGVGEPLLPADLEPSQEARAVAQLESETDAVEDEHVAAPDHDGDWKQTPERGSTCRNGHHLPAIRSRAGRVANTASHHGALTPNHDRSSRKWWCM